MPESNLFVPHRVKSSSLQDKASWLLKHLEQFAELDSSSSCRLTIISRELLAEKPIQLEGNKRFFEIIQAFKDLNELHYIYTVLEPKPTDAKVWHVWSEVFGGQGLPSGESTKSSARDAQYELLVHAMLERSGLSPIKTERGADFDCELGNFVFCVEAKRLKGAGDLARTLKKEALRQVCDSGRPGIVFLDVSRFAGAEDNVYYSSTPVRHDGLWNKVQFGQFYKLHHASIEDAFGNSPVRGVVFTNHAILQDGLSDTANNIGDWGLVSLMGQAELKGFAGNPLTSTVFELLSGCGYPDFFEH